MTGPPIHLNRLQSFFPSKSAIHLYTGYLFLYFTCEKCMEPLFFWSMCELRIPFHVWIKDTLSEMVKGVGLPVRVDLSTQPQCVIFKDACNIIGAFGAFGEQKDDVCKNVLEHIHYRENMWTLDCEHSYNLAWPPETLLKHIKTMVYSPYTGWSKYHPTLTWLGSPSIPRCFAAAVCAKFVFQNDISWGTENPTELLIQNSTKMNLPLAETVCCLNISETEYQTRDFRIASTAPRIRGKISESFSPEQVGTSKICG